jgi:hypothetical protein
MPVLVKRTSRFLFVAVLLPCEAGPRPAVALTRGEVVLVYLCVPGESSWMPYGGSVTIRAGLRSPSGSATVDGDDPIPPHHAPIAAISLHLRGRTSEWIDIEAAL